MVILLYGLRLSKRDSLHAFLHAGTTHVIYAETLKELLTALRSYNIQVIIAKDTSLKHGGLTAKSPLFTDVGGIICVSSTQKTIMPTQVKVHKKKLRKYVKQLLRLCSERRPPKVVQRIHLSKASKTLMREFIRVNGDSLHRDTLAKLIDGSNSAKAINKLHVCIHRLRKELATDPRKKYSVVYRNKRYSLLIVREKKVNTDKNQNLPAFI